MVKKYFYLFVYPLSRTRKQSIFISIRFLFFFSFSFFLLERSAVLCKRCAFQKLSAIAAAVVRKLARMLEASRIAAMRFS